MKRPQKQETIEKIRVSIKKYWDNISVKEKDERIETLRIACNKKESREKISIKATGRITTEKTRKILSEAQIKSPLNYFKKKGRFNGVYTEERRKNMSEKMSGDGNPMFGKKSPHAKKTLYDGNWFRSTWEAEFVKYLDKKNIKWEYELYRIYFSEDNNITYLPDFYLPEHGFWVEVKGWMKERDKRKHDLFEVFVKDRFFLVQQKEIDLIKNGKELEWLNNSIINI